jgi:hypothetical protein
MSGRKSQATVLVVGGMPRADLLPPEIKADAAARGQRRVLVGAVILVAAAVVAAYVGATVLSLDASVRLLAANEETNELLVKKGEYIVVRQLSDQVEVAEAARTVAMSTEIDWEAYLADVSSRLPAGASISNISVTSATPTSSLPSVSGPFAVPRLADFAFTVTSPGFIDGAQLLESMETLPGFIGMAPGTIASEEAGFVGTYSMSVDEGALSNRFSTPTPEAAK